MLYSNYRKTKLVEAILYNNVVWRYENKQEMSDRLTNPDDLVYLDEYEIEAIYSNMKKDMPTSMSGRDDKIVQIVNDDEESRYVTVKFAKHSTGWYMANLIITSDKAYNTWYVCPQNGIAGVDYLCAIIAKEINKKY